MNNYLTVKLFILNKVVFKSYLIIVNARYLAHALLSEWSFSCACATLSRRLRKFFLAHAQHMGKI